jgi:hypothetical protein
MATVPAPLAHADARRVAMAQPLKIPAVPPDLQTLAAPIKKSNPQPSPCPPPPWGFCPCPPQEKGEEEGKKKGRRRAAPAKEIGALRSVPSYPCCRRRGPHPRAVGLPFVVKKKGVHWRSCRQFKA